MADERAKPNRAVERSAERGTQSNPTNEPEEVRYSAEELHADAKSLLGVSPHAVAGALHDAGQKTFTLDQAKSRVDKFLKRTAEGAEEAEA